ncbi:MAG: TetR/AcrR family transcriptional regulator [Bacteroidota bacterium]
MTEKDKQTEGKIFESATEVFIEKGMDGARMQDIADHAGINKSLLHYYYRTKDHLFNAVFEMIAGQMFKKFAPIFDQNLSLEEKIRFFFREHITFLQKNPRLPGFMMNEIHRNPDRIKKFLQTIDIQKLWTTLEAQHKEELARYNLNPDTIPQFMTSVAAMSVFPFIAKPIVSSLMEKMGYNFDEYLEERKEYAADFVINAMKKK